MQTNMKEDCERYFEIVWKRNWKKYPYKLGSKDVARFIFTDAYLQGSKYTIQAIKNTNKN